MQHLYHGEMDWDDFKFFSAVAHSGSVRQAAQLLGVHASTVTRRLDQFERRLGVKLFARSRSGLQITLEGAEVIHEVDGVAAELDEIQRRLQHRARDMAGLLRITLAEGFAENLLIHDFAEFSTRYPEIQLIFVPDHQNPNLDRHEVDLAIRVTNDPPEHLIGRRLGKTKACVYASVTYLDHHDPWTRAQDCVWIETDYGPEGITRETDSTEDSVKYFPAMPRGVCAQSLALHLAAIKGGMGVGLLPCSVGDAEITLKRLAGISAIETAEVWMFIHPDLRNLARLQVLLAFIQQTFSDHPDRLLGKAVQSTNTI